jgi:hypothetical protein
MRPWAKLPPGDRVGRQPTYGAGLDGDRWHAAASLPVTGIRTVPVYRGSHSKLKDELMNKMGPDTLGSQKEDEDDHDWCPRLDRRVAIRLLGYSALAAATGCGSTTRHSSISAANSSSQTTATTTSLTTSSSAVEQSIQVTLTATLTPSPATGTVTFYDGTASLGSSMTSLARMMTSLSSP